MDEPDDDLEAAVAELARTLRDLRRELDAGRDSPLDPRSPRFLRPPGRGPVSDRGDGPRRGLRPPTPGELLRAADEVAIPALIAILEANVRALEAFQRALRLLRREREVRDRTADVREETRSRAESLRDRTLDRLDGALAELERSVSADPDRGGPAARDLIEEARELRDTVDERLTDASDWEPDRGSGVDGIEDGTDAGAGVDGYRIEIDEGPHDRRTQADGDDEGPDVDVDAELETLREQYGSDDGADRTTGSGEASDRGRGDPGDATGADGSEAVDADEPAASDEPGERNGDTAASDEPGERSDDSSSTQGDDRDEASGD